MNAATETVILHVEESEPGVWCWRWGGSGSGPFDSRAEAVQDALLAMVQDGAR